MSAVGTSRFGIESHNMGCKSKHQELGQPLNHRHRFFHSKPEIKAHLSITVSSNHNNLFSAEGKAPNLSQFAVLCREESSNSLSVCVPKNTLKSKPSIYS